MLKVARSGYSPCHSLSAVDGQPPREAAASRAQRYRWPMRISQGPQTQPRNEKSSPSSATPARTPRSGSIARSPPCGWRGWRSRRWPRCCSAPTRPGGSSSWSAWTPPRRRRAAAGLADQLRERAGPAARHHHHHPADAGTLPRRAGPHISDQAAFLNPCWCSWRIHADVLERAIHVYRTASAVADADCAGFRRDVDAAAVGWAFVSTSWFLRRALRDDPPPADPSKPAPTHRQASYQLIDPAPVPVPPRKHQDLPRLIQLKCVAGGPPGLLW